MFSRNFLKQSQVLQWKQLLQLKTNEIKLVLDNVRGFGQEIPCKIS